MTIKTINRYLLLLFFLASLSLSAQVDKNSDLYKTIISRDSLLFKVGFNTCDIRQFETLLTEDFEFFHDEDSISNKKKFIYNLRNGLCASTKTYQLRRDLITGSTEIYPLYKDKVLYGAIQIGIHKFYRITPDKKETPGSSARFTHLWLLQKDTWRLARALSYDHDNTTTTANKTAIFDNDTEIEKWLKENNVPTLGLGIINDGKLQQIKVFGELKKGVTAPYNTIFNVASLTKPITAMVTLKLVSLGKWDLDEPLYKYWIDPDIANDPKTKKITTRQVLSHQTGFPNWRWNSPDKKLHFESEPGTKYQYSGEGFEYLRKALEKKFNKTLDQLAKELLFTPLQMNDTNYIWDKKIDESCFAIGYDPKGNAYETEKRKTANAADDVLTTIEDYGKFLISVMNGDGLSKKVFDDMRTNQVEMKPKEYYGLGFVIYDLGNGEIALSHGGADQGVQTIFFILPKIKQGILIFTNVDDGYKVYEKLLFHYLGDNGRKIFEIETKN
ncbi:serine hydrolase [Flavobacterium sp. PS2]|uniref:serine hydrolase n=1 Tax=Flavobacterium sp. PS2 TaxID=3384157 RepID=UPI00390CA3D3